MTFFDAFWYVFNFLSIALVVVFLCMNLTPRSTATRHFS